jgi:nicotinamidase-related amidase
MNIGLILVDIQNDYFPGGRMDLVGIDNAAANAKALLEYFRKKKLPVFFIQHISVGEKASFFLPDTDGVKIHESINPLAEETVIQKHYPNSFRETRLLDELQKAEIQHVVICGAMSHMCIDATARTAADFGFGCTVVENACATRDLQFAGETIPAAKVHGAFMAALGAAYAKVTNADEFISRLEKE